MPVFTAKVYLNQARDSFFGFNAISPADLNLAATFDIGAPDHNVALENVFGELNIDSPSEPWARRWRLQRYRSLSVGDVVVLGEVAWACESAGWKAISTAELEAAITD